MTLQYRRSDAGFTLIETLIAMIVMSVAVVAIVSALAGMTASTRAHRGHAVVEAGVRSFSQAIQARVHARTQLTSAITTTTQAAITVAKPAVLPAAGGYIAVGRETMKIVSISGNTVTVERAKNDPNSAETHLNGAAVVPVFRCPSAADLTPPASDYTVPPGVTVAVAPGVQHWDPAAGAFVSQAACVSAYDATCIYDDGGGGGYPADIRHECGGGLQRVTINVTTPNGPEFRGVDTTTTFLVRRGSS